MVSPMQLNKKLLGVQVQASTWKLPSKPCSSWKTETNRRNHSRERTNWEFRASTSNPENKQTSEISNVRTKPPFTCALTKWLTNGIIPPQVQLNKPWNRCRNDLLRIRELNSPWNSDYHARFPGAFAADSGRLPRLRWRPPSVAILPTVLFPRYSPAAASFDDTIPRSQEPPRPCWYELHSQFIGLSMNDSTFCSFRELPKARSNYA